MKNFESTELKLDELAERAGVPARTIRLYITRGLVPGPRRAGPRAAYGAEHLESLAAIRKLQDQGLTLAQIRQALAGSSACPAPPQPAPWLSYTLAEDLVVMVRGDASPWRLRQLQAAMAHFMHQIQETERKETRDEHGD